jgi:predicted CoA-binding protein
MNENYTDAHLKSVLHKVKNVAVVGISTNPARPSYFVGRYLALKGFNVIPVNPGQAGKVLFGKTIIDDLRNVDEPVDMVDIFRKSEAVPEIVDTALECFPNLKCVWMQIGVFHQDAADKARACGVDVVMNRCPKIEYQRLFGELRMGGFNTGIISSKL